MGAMRVAGMIEMAGPEVALRDHLEHGLFPPIGAGAYEFAMLAIEACEAEEFGLVVEADGFGGPAGEVVDSWHLGAFVGLFGDGF